MGGCVLLTALSELSGYASAGWSPVGLGYSVAPVIGVRVAGSSVGELHGLRCAAAWAVAGEHVALTRWLRAEGEKLSDLLFPEIGRCVDGGLKGALVALRRALFQGKSPNGRAWSEEVRQALGGDLTARITAWLERVERARLLERHLPAVLAADRQASVAALRDAVAQDSFRFGLLQGSPTLADVLSVWIDQPSAKSPGPQVLIRAAKYLSRAAAKTSPYASFTLSGLGSWAESSLSSHTNDLVWHGVVELERRISLWIWSGLAERPEFGDRIAVQVNPSAVEIDERLCFVGAAAGEPVVEVDLTDPLRDLLEVVRTTPAPTMAELSGHVAKTSDDPHAGVAVVRRLVELGLVEPRRPFSDQDPDPLGGILRWLDATDSPGTEALRGLREDVRGYCELPDARARARRLRRMHTALSGVLAEVTHPPAELPDKELIRENAVLTHPVVSLAQEQWQPVLDDLDILRGFLGIFNPHLPIQAAATEFFLDRFAPDTAVEFLRFYRDFHRVERPSTEPPRELVEMRRAAVRALYDESENVSGVLRVRPRTLAAIAAAWPPYIRAPRSVCCYGQPLPGPNGPRLVLNTICIGYGWGMNRIHHLINQTGARPPWPIHANGEDVLLADCRAAFGTNLNLRPATVAHVIDYPSGQDESDSAARISMAELTVSYDRARSRLALRNREGVKVRPLALGMLVEHALPPALYFLVRVFSEPQTAFAPRWQLGNAGWRGAPDGVRRRPRMELGHLVLLRAAWSIPLVQLPLRPKGETDAAYLLRVAGWREQHGIPEQCFVRMAGAGRGLGKVRKPLYLDFASWLLLTAFERSLKDLDGPNAAVVFEEALPDLADAPRYGEHGQRVTEYIIELGADG